MNTVVRERESFKYEKNLWFFFVCRAKEKNGTFEENSKQPQKVDQVIKTYII